METFGYKPEQTLNRFSGQNEFLSALHSLEADPGLSDPAKVAVASMIESTVPFRGPNSSQELAERVAGQHILNAEETRAVALASAHLANRDVKPFAGPADRFQENTHNLMREGGADLTDPESIAKRAMGDAKFFGDLARDVANGTKEIYRNSGRSNGAPLMSPEELNNLNGRAVTQLNGEVARLRAMAAASGEAMMDGHRGAGSVSFEDITRRAEDLMRTTSSAEIDRRAEIAPKLAKGEISTEDARRSTSERPPESAPTERPVGDQQLR
jgi:hypothetical protein